MQYTTNTIYESSNLKFNLKAILKTVLETDNGFFTDEVGNMLGKIIRVTLTTNLDGTTTVEAKYPVIIQHFPGGYTITWVFNGYTYEHK